LTSSIRYVYNVDMTTATYSYRITTSEGTVRRASSLRKAEIILGAELCSAASGEIVEVASGRIVVSGKADGLGWVAA
jgi:hypothetical protein